MPARRFATLPISQTGCQRVGHAQLPTKHRAMRRFVCADILDDQAIVIVWSSSTTRVQRGHRCSWCGRKWPRYDHPPPCIPSAPTHRARTSPQMENPAGRIVMRYRVDKVKEVVRYLAPACTQLAGRSTYPHPATWRTRQVLEPTVPAMNSTRMDSDGAGKVTSRACDLSRFPLAAAATRTFVCARARARARAYCTCMCS